MQEAQAQGKSQWQWLSDRGENLNRGDRGKTETAEATVKNTYCRERGKTGTAGGEVESIGRGEDKSAFRVDIPDFTKWHLIFRDFSLNNTMNPKGGVDG